MTSLFRPLALAILTFTALCSRPLEAQNEENTSPELEYFRVDVAELVASAGPDNIVSDHPIPRGAWYQIDVQPRVVVPTQAEAYLKTPESYRADMVGVEIVGSKPKGKAIRGNVYLLRKDTDDAQQNVLAKLTFKVGAKTKTPATRNAFLQAKGKHFQHLWSEQLAGSAMFRHLAVSSLKEIGETAEASRPKWPLRGSDGVDESIRLMSGGRAVSENLQLDQQIETTGESSELKSLSDVRGITVREIDWSTRLSDKPTELDPLATHLPHDQYAVFLPSFQALTTLVEESDQLTRPVVQWFEPQSRRRDVLAFYQAQLGLPLNALTKQVGKALIQEVAITGSDPYFRTGTDFALLMKADQPALLRQALVTQIMASAEQYEDSQQIQHESNGFEIAEWSTRDRRFCSLIATTENAVVISNSLHQMRSVLNASADDGKSLDELDEYKFFRQRYPRGADDESALVMISDATIRKWCGPQWRISASRRTRARATIAEMTMQNADRIVRNQVGGTIQIESKDAMPDAGRMWLTAAGVQSETYGTLSFQTPISELDIQKATAEEIELYENWRQRYERQWRNAFDPIALKLSVDQAGVSADLSVIPLMIRTQYRDWLNWVGTATLSGDSKDPHPESMGSLDVAINMDSTYVAFARSVLNQRSQGNVDLFSWIDGSFSVYLDSDPEWLERISNLSPFDFDEQDMIAEAPIGVFVPSKDTFRLTAFVVAVRSMLDEFAPNVMRWEKVDYKGNKYVVASPADGSPLERDNNELRLYYVTTPQGLTLSPNRNVILRAIDRQLVDTDPTDDAKLHLPETLESGHKFEPQIAARLTGNGAGAMAKANYRGTQARMSRIAWGNLPIMNYLRHRYPDRDPKQVYLQLLGEELLEPAGGGYQWSDRFQSYESTHFGHVMAPQIGPPVSSSLAPGDVVETSISFAGDGLRATLNWRPEQK